MSPGVREACGKDDTLVSCAAGGSPAKGKELGEPWLDLPFAGPASGLPLGHMRGGGVGWGAGRRPSPPPWPHPSLPRKQPLQKNEPKMLRKQIGLPHAP